MTGDITFVEGPLKFLLDFREVDPRDIGVEVRLEIEYLGQDQNLKWTAARVWLEYEALLRFESELGNGDEAQLNDMSQYPLLHFVRDSSHEYLVINPHLQRQSQDGERMGIRLAINTGSMQTLYSALNQFGKWW